ncbi:MAG: hypothetical protein WA419_11875 [Silvibacterium sp.]
MTFGLLLHHILVVNPKELAAESGDSALELDALTEPMHAQDPSHASDD